MKTERKEIVTTPLIEALLYTPLFSIDGKPTLKIGEAIRVDSLCAAQKTVESLNQNMIDSPSTVIARVIPRATSYDYQAFLAPFSSANSLAELLALTQATEQQTQSDAATSSIPTPPDVVAKQWCAFTTSYETRAAIQRQQTAKSQKLKYQQEIATKAPFRFGRFF